jgi:phage major head subunit gpT-like protein
LDLEFDQYGVYSDMLIPNLARHAKLNADVQIAAEITANNVGYDGKAMFASDHPVDPSGQRGGSQSNIITTSPLNSTNLAKAQATLMNLLGPDGIPMGSYGDTILCPPSLKYVADTLANAAFYPESKNNVSGTFGAQTNVFQGAYKVVASPYLTDTGDPTTAVWYLVDARSKLRPWFWQEFSAPQLVSVVDPAAYSVFLKDQFMMGARQVANSASALWFKAVKATT